MSPGAVPLVFGEVLFDRFPGGEEVLGGAPFNVAWNLHAFGARPRFVSRVGDDALGRRILDAMEAWGMDRSGVQIDAEHGTGTVTVSLDGGEPTFEIDTDRAWDFVSAAEAASAATSGGDAIGLLYHGMLALRSPTSRAALDALVAATSAPLFVDVNLRDPWWSADDVRARLAAARWAKLNAGELDALSTPDVPLDAWIVTRGAEGAEVRTASGDVHRVRPPEGVDVVDTVGAGDAFSSVCILGRLRGWDWPTTLERAQTFAAAVVGLRGATTGERPFYDSIATDWETP